MTGRKTLVAAAALLASACAHRGRPPPGREDAPVVREVRVEGARALDEDDVRDGLATRATGRWPWSERRFYDPLAASNDERRIETFYALNGHHDVEVEHAVQEEGGRARVVFTVREGPPTRLRAVRFEGAEALPEDVRAEALRGLPLSVGAVVRAADYDVARVLVQRRLAARGYAAAKVDGRIDVYPDEQVADVTLEVAAGPLHRYGELAFRGLHSLPEEPLRALVGRHVVRGRRHDPEAVALAEARLRDLGAFRTVRISPDEPEEDGGESLVRVTVEELPVHGIALGGGVGIEQNLQQVQGIVQYRHTNILGGAEQLSWRNQVAMRFVPSLVDRERSGLDVETRLELTVPDLLPRTDFAAQTGYNHVFRQAFEADVVSGRLAFGYVLGVGSRVTPALGYERHLGLSPRRSRGPVPERSRLSCPDPCQQTTVSVAFAHDGRDALIEPRRGHLLLVDVQYGFPLTNGGLHFARAVPEARAYFPAARDVTLAARARVGALFPLGATEASGLPQRFFGGGDGGHRGFGPEQLGPVVEDEAGGFVTAGGDGLWLVTVEPRLRLSERWGLVAFADLGDVTAEPLRIDPAEAHLALGAGVRLRTVAGPVRLDLAYRLPRRARHALDTGAPAERDALDYFTFFLSLGEAF